MVAFELCMVIILLECFFVNIKPVRANVMDVYHPWVKAVSGFCAP